MLKLYQHADPDSARGKLKLLLQIFKPDLYDEEFIRQLLEKANTWNDHELAHHCILKGRDEVRAFGLILAVKNRQLDAGHDYILACAACRD